MIGNMILSLEYIAATVLYTFCAIFLISIKDKGKYRAFVDSITLFILFYCMSLLVRIHVELEILK